MKEMRTVSDYLAEAKRIKKAAAEGSAHPTRKFKIAVLPSFTINAMSDVLLVKCDKAGINADFYNGGYNQYAQEILDPASRLHAFQPDLTLLFIDLASLMGEAYFNPYSQSDSEREEWVKKTTDQLTDLVERFKARAPGKLLLHNFETPAYSPMGILESKQRYGLTEAVEDLNSALRKRFKTDERVFLFDYNAFCSKVGKRNLTDQKMYYLGDIKLAMGLFPDLCEEYMGYIKPLCSVLRKCIVVDLDNTLWGGVIGEDGMKGIKLGPTPDGRPFMEFQKQLLALHDRGVILALNSKNNERDALEVFRTHPSMILKERHFAAMKINWDDKASNMRTLAKELNIGLDSMVFIDDDKLNCDLVRQTLPQVLVVELPKDPALYVNELKSLNDFNVLQLTAEDRAKGKMYAEQKSREQLREASANIDDYLRELAIKLTLEPASDFNIPRLAQLTQKTNQFNMTTKRYHDEQVREFATSERHLVISVRVEDKFGDNGITGLAIVEKAADNWIIDTFLLSCRVLGRKVEDAIVSFIANKAKAAGARALIGTFVPTAKNDPAKGFYEAAGFLLTKRNGDAETWRLDLAKIKPMPEYITVITKEV